MAREASRAAPRTCLLYTSCVRVLELCAPALERLCPQGPEKGWEPFIYQYVCRLMFPENGFAPEAGRYAQEMCIRDRFRGSWASSSV